MIWRYASALICSVALGACTNPFGSDWAWFADGLPDSDWRMDFTRGDIYRIIETNRAIEAEAKRLFPETLRRCVSAYDPNRLADLDAGEQYEVSGLFVDQQRVAPVLKCMRDKGWHRIGRFNL